MLPPHVCTAPATDRSPEHLPSQVLTGRRGGRRGKPVLCGCCSPPSGLVRTKGRCQKAGASWSGKAPGESMPGLGWQEEQPKEGLACQAEL